MTGPTRRKNPPQIVGELVNQVLEDLGHSATARALRIADHWEEAVGAEVALHSRPISVRRDVLEIAVDSSVWCQQLQLRVPEILTALRSAVGDDAPARVWLRVNRGG